MCKQDCARKKGSPEEGGETEEIYDDLEGVEEEEPENIYDDLDLGGDGNTEKDKIKVVDFEKRWSLKVRLIPESMSSNYVYYDPQDNDNRMPSKDVINIVSRPMSSSGSSSQASSPSPSPVREMVRQKTGDIFDTYDDYDMQIVRHLLHTLHTDVKKQPKVTSII